MLQFVVTVVFLSLTNSIKRIAVEDKYYGRENALCCGIPEEEHINNEDMWAQRFLEEVTYQLGLKGDKN